MWVRFDRGVINGEYDDKLVFLTMIQATIMAHDRKPRGVGLQNMAYLPIYDEFTQMVALASPRTYKFFAPHIQLPFLPSPVCFYLFFGARYTNALNVTECFAPGIAFS